MNDRDLLRASAHQQAELIRRGEISSEELTRFYLERIDRCDTEVHSMVELHPERALFAAKKKDQDLRKRDADLPPFHGVPTAIKDINFVRGMFTRMGSRAFCLFSPVDDLLTRRIRAGGFVIVGKTSTAEFGVVPVVETDVHPPTRNPWDPSRTAGGSSGGAGAAVAAGLLPVAPGSDGAGSIRIPSAFCHLVGLKPSRGRVANAFGDNDRTILYTDGPMARTVEDAAAMLDLLARTKVDRACWAPPPTEPFAQLSRQPLAPLKIRLVTTNPMGEVDSRIAQAARTIARSLEANGHQVTEGDPPNMTTQEFMPVWQHMAAQAPVSDWRQVQPIMRWLAEPGQRISDAFALRRRVELSDRVLTWFEGADVVLSPTTPTLPDRVGAFREFEPEEGFARMAVYGYFTAAFNLTGQPAMSIPAGISPEGLPLGVQLVGKPFAEATLLALAHQIEKEHPWADRDAFLGLGGKEQSRLRPISPLCYPVLR